MFRSRSAGDDKLGRISTFLCEFSIFYQKRFYIIFSLLIYFIIAEELLDFQASNMKILKQLIFY